MYAYSFVGNAKCKVQNVASFKPQNNIYKGGTFILSIWQMIKLKLREIKKFLTQGIQEVSEMCMNSLQVCILATTL